MEEIWKDIPGYENYYQASNLGRIRSKDRLIIVNDYQNAHAYCKGFSYVRPGKVLKARLMKKAMMNGHNAVQAQEREAYSHQDYERVVEAIQIATEEETKAYWELEMFRTEIDVWRTEQANNRRIMD